MGFLRVAEATSFSALLSRSSWRRRRLLILCYHGISQYDEHEWGNLYIESETFRRRMKFLREFRCNVLPLSEALDRLQSDSLPERATTITFDDGLHDFYSVAFPILESFGYPVTLYLTTYYVEFNRPVFDPMCSYLLWKGRDKQQLTWDEVLPTTIALDAPGRQRATAMLKQFCLTNRLSGQEKDDLLSQLADRLDVDYQDLRHRRILHLITPQEAKYLAARGVDLQYHTHRHRMHRSRDSMFAELEENNRRILMYTPKEPCHFCYTGGFYLPEHPHFLREYGIKSATTCYPGLCTIRTNPMLLPRLVDTMDLSDLEFRAWLSGTASLIPRRSVEMSKDQLVED